jgi:hydroxymethylpyrimidine pyrophosphatase-like HAD family hydrolase
MAFLSTLQPGRPNDPFLLAADIDGTLIGDEEGEKLLRLLVKQFPASLHLALVTGRGVPRVVELLKGGRLPPPDYVCGAVGTELFASNDPKNAIGQRYAARVPPGWDLEAIYALGEGQGITRQEFPEGQPRFQAGFNWDGDAATLGAFRNRFAGREGYYILPSNGKFIDVLPAALGKGNFVRFLTRDRKSVV